ncbi:uncharacterized protein LOC126791416 [Argentina anserina]|uniref:uncharacterized protein LOC126791416 n=1 Tax=Argentina anserina TaxID=57926 RepID=UPI0021763ABC|nr:uncharacterized protein LOC126791416 [Potentilla anserina]XP_050373825.1 uncharacterized protein LOC126791416 [Potentilla anserina]
MDSSKPYVRLSAAQDISESSNPQQKLGLSSSSSLSGSVLIRAPLTLDSDSDSEINGGNELGYITSGSNISVGSECGFVSGEEFETASERPFVAADSVEESGSVERYEVFWPSVSDPDEYEEVVGRVMVGDQVSEGVRPIANVSWESDGSEEIEEVKEENGGLLGHVKALVFGFVEQVSIAPRVKICEVEEGEEDESLVVDESNFVECGNEDTVQAVEECSFTTAESSETNSAETAELNLNVLEGGEKDKYVEEESFVGESCENLEEFGVEGNEKQSMGGGHISEDKVESDCFNSITPRSVLGGNVATGLGIQNTVANWEGLVSIGDAGVQVQGSEAKVEVPFKERGFTMEHDPISLGLFVESATQEIKVFEVEEEESVMEENSSNSFIKQSELVTDGLIEENDLGGEETMEPLENSTSMAEESMMHCPKSKTCDVHNTGSSGALDRGVHSECVFGIEGSKNQMRDDNTYSQPNLVLKIVYLGKRNLSEAAEGGEPVLCSDFIKSITPSSSVSDEHIFGGETKVRNCKIGRRLTGVAVTHMGEDATTGLKIEDQIVMGKNLLLTGSAGAVQCHGDTACGAKLELCLKENNFRIKQDQTSLGLSFMKWGGGLVLATDILSRFTVGNSKIDVHVVLDNKQRGKIAIRTSNSDKIQSAGIFGILSVAVSAFGFLRSRFSVQNSR